MTGHRFVLAITCALLLAALGIWWWWGAGAPVQTVSVMPDGLDLSEGEVLFAGNCASCHGARLEGQQDWKIPGEDGKLPAPPHDETGHTWHHADDVLFRYTKLGGREALAASGMNFDSGMPGFADRLSDDEIWSILAYIQSTWPEHERAAQAAATALAQQTEGN